MSKRTWLVGLLVVISMLMTSCAVPAPQVVEKSVVETVVVEVEVEKPVVQTVVVETEKPVEVQKTITVVQGPEPVSLDPSVDINKTSI